jgi:hypothetical protein
LAHLSVRFPLAHLSVRRSPFRRYRAGQPSGVPSLSFHGDQLRSPLRNPRPGGHIYPDGIKAHGHERITQFIGRRGKPIKKLRYIPMALAHQLARKLQGRPGTTVSVL